MKARALAWVLGLALASASFAALKEETTFPLNGSLESSTGVPLKKLNINPLTGSSADPEFVPGPKGKALRVTGDRCAAVTDVPGLSSGDDLTVQFMFRVEQQRRPTLTLVSVSLPAAWLEIQLDGKRGTAQLILKLFGGVPPKGVPPLEPMMLEKGEAFHDGKWHHLALVLDRKREGEARVYLDKARVSPAESWFLPSLADLPNRQPGWVAFGAGVPWVYGLPGATGSPDDLAFDFAEVVIGPEPEGAFELKAPLGPATKARATECQAQILKILGQ